MKAQQSTTFEHSSANNTRYLRRYHHPIHPPFLKGTQICSFNYFMNILWKKLREINWIARNNSLFLARMYRDVCVWRSQQTINNITKTQIRKCQKKTGWKKTSTKMFKYSPLNDFTKLFDGFETKNVYRFFVISWFCSTCDDFWIPRWRFFSRKKIFNTESQTLNWTTAMWFYPSQRIRNELAPTCCFTSCLCF